MHQNNIKEKLLTFLPHRKSHEVKNFYKEPKKYIFNIDKKRLKKWLIATIKVTISIAVIFSLLYISFYIVSQ